MTCDHSNPERVEWPGGYAVQVERGAWTGYFLDRPGEVFAITACPVCLVQLHTRKAGMRQAPELPTVAFSDGYRRRHNL